MTDEQLKMPTTAEMLTELLALQGHKSQKLRDVVDFDIVAVQRLLCTGFVDCLSWMNDAGFINEETAVELLRRFKDESEAP